MGEAMMALVGVGACVCSVIAAIGTWLACGRVVWGGGDIGGGTWRTERESSLGYGCGPRGKRVHASICSQVVSAVRCSGGPLRVCRALMGPTQADGEAPGGVRGRR